MVVKLSNKIKWGGPSFASYVSKSVCVCVSIVEYTHNRMVIATQLKYSRGYKALTPNVYIYFYKRTRRPMK